MEIEPWRRLEDYTVAIKMSYEPECSKRMQGIIREVDSHVADHDHISFRGHSWCRLLEDSGYIYHTQMLLIWPTNLNFENVICEGLLVTASVGFSQTHELLDLQWRIVSAKIEGSILVRRREEWDATSLRMSEKD